MLKTEGLVKWPMDNLRYINSVMPHGCRIYATASDMAMDKMYAYPTSQHALPH